MTPPAREPLIQFLSSSEAAGRLVPAARRTQNRPRWLPYEAAAIQAPPRYLVFTDAESLAEFLRVRGSTGG